MKSSPKLLHSSQINPLDNIIIDKKNEYNIIDKYNIIYQEKKAADRGPVSFYMSRSISQSWRRWCGMNGQKDYLLIESACIEYMQNHPVQQVSLNVIPDIENYMPNIKERLQNKIIREKISAIIAIIRRRLSEGTDWKTQRVQLQKLVMQATKLKKPDSDLLDLLRQSEELV